MQIFPHFNKKEGVWVKNCNTLRINLLGGFE
jgi:hypothetical protein